MDDLEIVRWIRYGEIPKLIKSEHSDLPASLRSVDLDLIFRTVALVDGYRGVRHFSVVVDTWGQNNTLNFAWDQTVDAFLSMSDLIQDKIPLLDTMHIALSRNSHGYPVLSIVAGIKSLVADSQISTIQLSNLFFDGDGLYPTSGVIKKLETCAEIEKAYLELYAHTQDFGWFNQRVYLFGQGLSDNTREAGGYDYFASWCQCALGADWWKPMIKIVPTRYAAVRAARVTNQTPSEAVLLLLENWCYLNGIYRDTDTLYKQCGSPPNTVRYFAPISYLQTHSATIIDTLKPIISLAGQWVGGDYGPESRLSGMIRLGWSDTVASIISNPQLLPGVAWQTDVIVLKDGEYNLNTGQFSPCKIQRLHRDFYYKAPLIHYTATINRDFSAIKTAYPRLITMLKLTAIRKSLSYFLQIYQHISRYTNRLCFKLKHLFTHKTL